MTAEIIDGKSLAADVRGWVSSEVSKLVEAHGLTPGLAVVIVGDDPASHVYVRNKRKQTVGCGMESIEHTLPADTSESDLLALIAQLNSDAAVHGILVQLPMPEHIDSQKVIEAISPAKDVDGLHPENAGRLMAGLTGMVPCTPKGCHLMLRRQLGNMSGAEALVIGRSLLFGKPMGQLLLAENCTVTQAHSRTKDLAAHARAADILVAAVGRAEMVRGDWIKPGAVVIDVGINRIAQDGAKDKLVGDVAFDEAKEVAAAITPVPGGVGPMTIACLLYNALRAARLQNDLGDIELPVSF